MFLTAPDEYFNHQVALPHFMVGVSDPSWRERYWFSVQDVKAQDFIISGGFGKYPNRNVFEGCMMVQVGDRQWNFRASRSMLPDSDKIAVGPLSVEIIEPLKVLRIRAEPNASGISCDLTWRADLPAMLEGKHFEINHARVSHDIVRYVQLGRVEGRVEYPGGSRTLTLETGRGERDHSWGMRPMRGMPGDPPVASAEWNFLAFCPIGFDDFAVHLYIFEAQAGRPTHLSASIVRRDDPDEEDGIEAVEHNFTWDNDAPIRTLKGGSVTLTMFSGKTINIDIRALSPRLYLKGGGYGGDQGYWKADYFEEHEVWDLSDATKLREYVQGSSDHMFEARCDGKVGYGIVEYVVRSAYQKYARPPRAKG